MGLMQCGKINVLHILFLMWPNVLKKYFESALADSTMTLFPNGKSLTKVRHLQGFEVYILLIYMV